MSNFVHKATQWSAAPEEVYMTGYAYVFFSLG